jgi:malonyl-CoA/methylmalonyl-CoA synthetase
LPGVDIRIVDEQGVPVEPGVAGAIEVRGPGVFTEYWQRPEATRQAFREGWFRTGDEAIVEREAYRLLGRSSVDIIKTGGFKVSAWEIEDRCRQHPAVEDCAVVGLDDAEWGQRICAALQMQDGARGDAAAVGDWLSRQLAPYKVPREYRVVDTLPRNVMGKVVKAEVRALFAKPGGNPEPQGQ